jgi:hypothetical protein
LLGKLADVSQFILILFENGLYFIPLFGCGLMSSEFLNAGVPLIDFNLQAYVLGVELAHFMLHPLHSIDELLVDLFQDVVVVGHRI